jgi:hypothetical protein
VSGQLSRLHADSISRTEIELVDRATVSVKEAAFFFNMGERQFRRRFAELYYKKIDYADTVNGKRLSLMSVIRTACPEAKEREVYWMFFEYLKYSQSMRKIRAQGNGSGG